MFVANAAMLAGRTLLPAGRTPGALRTQVLAVFPGGPCRTLALPGGRVTRGTRTVTGLAAAAPEPPLRACLITVVATTTGGAFPLALSGHVMAGHTWGTGALLLTARTVGARVAFLAARVALVTGFARAGAMATVALQGVLLDTPTLFRAARAECPPGTRQVAEAAIETGLTQAGPVVAVTTPVVGTVTLLVAQLPIEALWAAVLAEVTADPRWTAAAPIGRIAAGPVPTLRGRRAVLAKPALRTRLVADESGPSVGAVAAVPPGAAVPPVGAVVTRQAAVVAKRLVQTHKLLGQVALGPQLCFVVLVVVVALQGCRAVILQQGQLGPQLQNPPAGQSLHCIPQQDTGAPVLIETEAPSAEALEGSGVVLARVVASAVGGQTLVHIVTAAPVGVEAVPSSAVALVAPWVVGAVLLTTRLLLATLVHVDAGFKVVVEAVTLVTGAHGPAAGMLAVVGTASVAVLTAVHYLHLDPVALLAVGAQLVGCETHAGVGAQGVVAPMGAVGLRSLTLVDVCAGLAVFGQEVSHLTVTVGPAPVRTALMHAASILISARILQLAVLAVLGQGVVGLTSTAEVGGGLLDTVVLTPSVGDGTRVDGQTGAGVHVQPGARVALAVEGAPRVDAFVLAAAIMVLALIGICSPMAPVVELVSM